MEEMYKNLILQMNPSKHRIKLKLFPEKSRRGKYKEAGDAGRGVQF